MDPTKKAAVRARAITALGALALAQACAPAASETQSGPEVTKATTAALSGTYRPVGPSAIAEITFVGPRYSLTRSDCSGDCVASGGFMLDPEAKTLRLQEDGASEATSLPFGIAEPTSESATRSILPRATDAPVVTGNEPIVAANPPVPLIVPRCSILQNVKIDGTPFANVSGLTGDSARSAEASAKISLCNSAIANAGQECNSSPSASNWSWIPFSYECEQGTHGDRHVVIGGDRVAQLVWSSSGGSGYWMCRNTTPLLPLVSAMMDECKLIKPAR